jgi:hypothetical protein
LPSICRIVALSSSVKITLAQAERRSDSRDVGFLCSTLSPFEDGLQVQPNEIAWSASKGSQR